jgi:hypothetical protein
MVSVEIHRHFLQKCRNFQIVTGSRLSGTLPIELCLLTESIAAIVSNVFHEELHSQFMHAVII